MRVGADELRRGLQCDEFEPFFQPIVTLCTGELAGFEILARWRHPEHGILLPDHFIALAEQDGTIGSLTGILLARAFAIAGSLPPHLRLSVNISPHQLHDFLLPPQIESLAGSFRFPLSRLVIEITESAFFDNLEHARAVTLELKKLGCRIALDDFGTGYSSLLHLQALPFDELKIDRSFVHSMTKHRESRKIVSAVIGLGQSLGLATIAEGVSTPEEAGLLLGLGCEAGQGWLFGKPVPADQLPALVQTPPQPIPRQSRNLSQEIFSSTLPSHRLAQLQALYEGAPVGLAFLDRNFRYIALNQQLASFHDNPLESYIGRTVAEMVPDIYPLIHPYLCRCLTGEAISGIEIICPARETRPETAFFVSYVPVYDEAHEVIGISVSVVDITERRRMEAALRESEDHYRHMVELNPQIPWVLDPQGMAVSIGPRWSELTGSTEEESLGRGFMQYVHPEDQQLLENTIARCFPIGEPVDVQFRARTRSGGWRWLRSRGSPRRDKQGNIVCWYGSTDDIDDLKRTEDALRRSEAHLQAVMESLSLKLQKLAAS
ncbi:EAL domain-containing protein [Silvibacterium dinghuense]|uniref:EAL domain-containing protein n=1 Tax=Silvibacterium dinghuense TaxID=1560006 RepID=A0A4Q1SIH6_9BACT|nr:EAL domain-containing protein [Silvibacterium dinghuense]RXS97411.1 EAL domain-containing protein [Silvibacterium dinghuense]GGG98794.1 hypothetical protein GCM10011586_12820 [Silvibacterium dinghuense]